MPRVKVVWSTQDVVGVNVAGLLAREYGVDTCVEDECELPGFNMDTPFMDDLDERLPGYDAYIIVSRHSSSSARATLSIHHTGNPTSETLGGEPYTLAWTWPRLAYKLFHAYRRNAEKRGLLNNYDFTLEATHHGPTRVSKPIIFIEIGSTEREWNDSRAVEALAETIYEEIISVKGHFEPKDVECRPVAGFGDTHYPRVHTRRVLERGYCYGHILSKHALKQLEGDARAEDVVSQAMTKSRDQLEAVVVAKISSRLKRLVESIASRHGLEVERV